MSGAGGGQFVSFRLSTQSLFISGTCPPATGKFTITNASSGPLTWHLSGNLSGLVVAPLSSTLPMGGAVDVSVTANLPNASTILSVDVEGAPSQSRSIQIDSVLLGYPVEPPPDIDFGDVPVGFSGKSVSIQYFSGYPGMILDSSNPAFVLQGLASNNGVWTLTFRSQTLGLQQTTLSISNMFRPVCPTNAAVIARATAVAP